MCRGEGAPEGQRRSRQQRPDSERCRLIYQRTAPNQNAGIIKDTSVTLIGSKCASMSSRRYTIFTTFSSSNHVLLEPRKIAVYCARPVVPNLFRKWRRQKGIPRNNVFRNVRVKKRKKEKRNTSRKVGRSDPSEAISDRGVRTALPRRAINQAPVVEPKHGSVRRWRAEGTPLSPATRSKQKSPIYHLMCRFCHRLS